MPNWNSIKQKITSISVVFVVIVVVIIVLLLPYHHFQSNTDGGGFWYGVGVVVYYCIYEYLKENITQNEMWHAAYSVWRCNLLRDMNRLWMWYDTKKNGFAMKLTWVIHWVFDLFSWKVDIDSGKLLSCRRRKKR